jgi:hypothetical protein
MPLFGPKRPPPFEAFKLKTYLKCGIARIKITRAKKVCADVPTLGVLSQA